MVEFVIKFFVGGENVGEYAVHVLDDRMGLQIGEQP